MFRSRFILTALVAISAALIVPATSQAAFTINISVDGATSGSGFFTQTFTDAQTATFFGVTGSASLTASNGDAIGVSFTESTNFPGTAIGRLTNSTVSATQSGSGTHVITVTTSTGTFTSPLSGKADLHTSLSIQGGFSASQIGSGFSFVSTASGTGVGGTSASTPNVFPTVNGSGTWFSGGSQFNTGTGSGAGYTLGQNVTFTIGSGNTLDNPIAFQMSSVVAAPAPAGLIMAATALPFFGLLRRRLRKSEVANAA